MNKKVNQGTTDPTVFVTKDRQRLKQYNDTVYLRDGDEFELELFNPTPEKVLAKIKINGHDLGSGIVLRPGERVYLERYLDESKKFVFETYSVDGNDRTVQKAIADNGEVQVEFYKESQPQIWISNTYTYPNWYEYPNQPSWTVDQPSVFYSNSSGGTTFQAGCSHTTGPDLNLNPDAGDLEFDSVQVNSNLETGRVEKGGHSNQQFVYDGTPFNSWSTWRMTWKILPMSQKARVREELAVYCTGCGAKRKKSSHRFCPHCGNQF